MPSAADIPGAEGDGEAAGGERRRLASSKLADKVLVQIVHLRSYEGMVSSVGVSGGQRMGLLHSTLANPHPSSPLATPRAETHFPALRPLPRSGGCAGHVRVWLRVQALHHRGSSAGRAQLPAVPAPLLC